MAIRHYPAIVEGDAKSGYSVFFLDLPGCTSGGTTLQEAALNAEEALAGYIALMIESDEPVPDPSTLDRGRFSRHRRSVACPTRHLSRVDQPDLTE